MYFRLFMWLEYATFTFCDHFIFPGRIVQIFPGNNVDQRLTIIQDRQAFALIPNHSHYYQYHVMIEQVIYST